MLFKDLQFGDFLGYHQYPEELLIDKLIDEAIEIKTGGPLCHCEIYVGNGKSFASRNGVGVGVYDFRAEGLICVLRPFMLMTETSQLHSQDVETFKLNSQEFISKVSGEAYDWKGLLNFYVTTDIVIPKHLFCSMAVIELYRYSLLLCGGAYYTPSNKYSPWDIFKLAGFNPIFADIDFIKKNL